MIADKGKIAMTQESHDHNFKNVFLDFPKEALEWLLPQVLKEWGPVRHVEFVRQEPKKRKLSDSHLVLDMPILFSFDQHQLLLWLVEFQEDKSKFSVYKILHYTANLTKTYSKCRNRRPANSDSNWSVTSLRHFLRSVNRTVGTTVALG